MSIPISKCLIYKAATGNEPAFKRLAGALEYNISKGSFTLAPCQCTPPCAVATDTQLSDLDTRLVAELISRRKPV